jgi:hypothetical protein
MQANPCEMLLGFDFYIGRALYICFDQVQPPDSSPCPLDARVLPRRSVRCRPASSLSVREYYHKKTNDGRRSASAGGWQGGGAADAMNGHMSDGGNGWEEDGGGWGGDVSEEMMMMAHSMKPGEFGGVIVRGERSSPPQSPSKGGVGWGGRGGGGDEMFEGELSGRTIARAVRPTTPSELRFKLPRHLQRGGTSRADISPGKAGESRPNTSGGEGEGEGPKPVSRQGSQMASPKDTRVGSRPVSRQQSRDGDSRPVSRQGSLAKASSRKEIEAWETEETFLPGARLESGAGEG